MVSIGVGVSVATAALALTTALIYWKGQQLRSQQARSKARIAGMRRSIAANLHDELGSLLMRVHLQAEGMRHHVQNNNDGLEQLLATTQAALLAMRDVAWGLDPSADTVEALQDRMRDLLDQLGPTTALHTSLATEGLENIVAVPGWMRQEIYQVFKEATTNVLRHATGATCLAVRLYGYHNCLKLEIKDDGAPSLLPGRSGMGLRNMQLRAQAVAGTLEAGPRTDGPGYYVCLQVPLGPVARTPWLRRWVK